MQIEHTNLCLLFFSCFSFLNLKQQSKTKEVAFLQNSKALYFYYILKFIKTLPHKTHHFLIQKTNITKNTNTLYHESADFWRHPKIKFLEKIHTVFLLGRTIENMCKYFYEPKWAI